MANAAKLEHVLGVIKMNPEGHKQNKWRVESDCGTTMCFAGWTVALEGARFIDEYRTAGGIVGYTGCVLPNGEEGPIEKIAMEILDLNIYEADHIFYNMGNLDDVERAVKDVLNGDVERID